MFNPKPKEKYMIRNLFDTSPKLTKKCTQMWDVNMASGADVTQKISEAEGELEGLSLSNEEPKDDQINEDDRKVEALQNGVEVHWGFGLQDLYRIALKFYKGESMNLLL